MGLVGLPPTLGAHFIAVSLLFEKASQSPPLLEEPKQKPIPEPGDLGPSSDRHDSFSPFGASPVRELSKLWSSQRELHDFFELLAAGFSDDVEEPTEFPLASLPVDSLSSGVYALNNQGLRVQTNESWTAKFRFQSADLRYLPFLTKEVLFFKII